MPQSALFTGIIPPVSTIFTADGQLDEQGTAALIDDLIKAGVDGLFFLGSGGEAPFKNHTAQAFLHLAQALAAQEDGPSVRLAVLTCQAQAARASDQPVPAQSLLWGLEKSVPTNWATSRRSSSTWTPWPLPRPSFPLCAAC